MNDVQENVVGIVLPHRWFALKHVTIYQQVVGMTITVVHFYYR